MKVEIAEKIFSNFAGTTKRKRKYEDRPRQVYETLKQSLFAHGMKNFNTKASAFLPAVPCGNFSFRTSLQVTDPEIKQRTNVLVWILTICGGLFIGGTALFVGHLPLDAALVWIFVCSVIFWVGFKLAAALAMWLARDDIDKH